MPVISPAFFILVLLTIHPGAVLNPGTHRRTAPPLKSLLLVHQAGDCGQSLTGKLRCPCWSGDALGTLCVIFTQFDGNQHRADRVAQHDSCQALLADKVADKHPVDRDIDPDHQHRGTGRDGVAKGQLENAVIP